MEKRVSLGAPHLLAGADFGREKATITFFQRDRTGELTVISESKFRELVMSHVFFAAAAKDNMDTLGSSSPCMEIL